MLLAEESVLVEYTPNWLLHCSDIPAEESLRVDKRSAFAEFPVQNFSSLCGNILVIAVQCDDCWGVEIWDVMSKRVQSRTGFGKEIHCFFFVEQLPSTKGDPRMVEDGRLLIGVDNLFCYTR